MGHVQGVYFWKIKTGDTITQKKSQTTYFCAYCCSVANCQLEVFILSLIKERNASVYVKRCWCFDSDCRVSTYLTFSISQWLLLFIESDTFEISLHLLRFIYGNVTLHLAFTCYILSVFVEVPALIKWTCRLNVVAC